MKYFLSILALFIFGCAQSNGGGTSTGNPLVAVNFKSYSAMSEFSEDASVQSVSALKMCFKRLRFKTDAGVDDNIDIDLGEMTISTSGTFVTAVEIPAGTYRRVEFDLDDHCPGAKSLRVTNSNGSYSTNDTMTIRFDGTLVLNSSQDLDLNIQAIISALNSVNSGSDIRNAAEGVGGSF